MKGRIDFVIPECYIDTNLVETLACPCGCNHQKGCNQVAKIMQEKFNDRFAVGIIDADKRRPRYLEEFEVIGSSEHLMLLHHHSRPHFIILVKPAADGFILACAEKTGVDLKDFGLAPILKDFTEQTKNVMSNKDPRFKRLFHAIKDYEEMRLFARILQMLIRDTYNVSAEGLSVIFKPFAT